MIKTIGKEVQWTNATKQDDIYKFTEKEFEITSELSRDLLEEQRPRIEEYKNFTLVVLSYPIDFNSEPVQVSIIITNKNIVSISDRHVEILDRLMERIKDIKTTSRVLSKIIEELNEYSIKLASEFESYLMGYENTIIKKPLKKNYTIILNDYKQRVFRIIKDIKANFDTVRYILDGKSRVKVQYIEGNLDDRLLFLKDELEYSKEIIDNMISQSMSAYNYALNKNLMNLTIVASILIIPTIITGLFGMNVALPTITFWQIMFLMSLLSIAIYKIIEKVVYRN